MLVGLGREQEQMAKKRAAFGGGEGLVRVRVGRSEQPRDVIP